MRLFASLRDRLPGAKRGEGWLELDEGATLLELIERLQIPDQQAQMVLVNGDQAPRRIAERGELRLSENDTVSIFPPLAGG
ncbi:MAG: MoaD/ThiS family protein [Myxococcota bacterium]